MAICKNCGAELAEGAKFCTSCGSPVDAPAEEKVEQETAEKSKVESKVEDAADKVKAVIDSGIDHSAEFDEKDKADNKVMAILAYIGILVLIPIFAAPQSKFARFHSNQGLILCIVWILVAIVGRIPLLGWIIRLVGYIACIVFAVKGIISANNGEAKEIPYVGKFKLIK